MSQNIHIRNVNAATLCRIDQLAEQAEMSRNSFLLKQLDFISVTEPLKDFDADVNLKFDIVTQLLLQQQQEIFELKELLKEIIDDEN